MNKLYGSELRKDYLTRRVGHISQVGGLRSYELNSGPQRGLRAVDVRTGTGFEFTVLPGRGMDISWASFKGVPIGYIAKSGVVSANSFVEEENIGFLRNFYAGLLTTAGLSNIGAPSSTDGQQYGLHGRVANIEADDVSLSQDWIGDDFVMRVSGTNRQARIFGECLLLKREITAKLGENKLVIRDHLVNDGFRPEPALLLYHCNFGYPLVGAATRLKTSGGQVEGRDAYSASFVEHHDQFQDPERSFKEQCFYHSLRGSSPYSFASIFNEHLNLGAYVKYRNENLPVLIEWKMMAEQDYVVGLEPSTAKLDGRQSLLDRNAVRILEPGDSISFEVEIGVLETDAPPDSA